VVRANLNKDPDDVSKMFDAVANRYDFLNDLLSLGRTKAWRRVVTSIIAPKPGIKILDIAAGTGSSSRPLVDKGADVIALDFSEGMLAQGRKQNRDIKFMPGDALNLPFEENTFDVTTISFGLRNTSNTSTALKEALRVTKVGGKIVVAEFSHPTNLIFRKVYLNYLMKALPVIARKVSKNPDAYVYLAESIRAWPDQAGLAQKMSDIGFKSVAWQDLTFGVVAAALTGPKRYNRAKSDAYECGIEPSPQAAGGGRFPVKYFLTAMLFIVFDIEIVFLYPWAVAFDQLGLFGLVEMVLFIGTVFVAFAYVWRRGGLEWD